MFILDLHSLLMNLILFLQGAQGTCSPPSSSVLCQNITTTADSGPQAEQLASRAAFSGQDMPTDSDLRALVGVY